MEREIQSEESDLETTEVETEVDDTQEILEEAKQLEGDKDEVSKEESHEESVRAALKEVEASKEDGNQGENLAPENNNAVKPVKKLVKAEALSDPELLAPERFDLKTKEIFNQLPPELKKAVHSTVKNLEGMATRATQDARKAAEDNRFIQEAVQPYVAEFGRLGLTAPQGIATLLAAHKRLVTPETSKEAYIALGKDLGFDTSFLEQDGESTNGNVDLSKHPQIQQLAAENKRLREMIEPVHSGIQKQQQSQNDAAEAQIFNELTSVINETDSSGRYVNPKLHEEEFLEAWKPLVSALIRTDKTIKTYKEAGQRAYDRLVGRSSSQSNQAKLPQNNRSVTAGVSVRGRNSAPISARELTETEISKDETPEQSAWRALEDLRRGL